MVEGDRYSQPKTRNAIRGNLAVKADALVSNLKYSTPSSFLIPDRGLFRPSLTRRQGILRKL
jgi:hypothetical protein